MSTDVLRALIRAGWRGDATTDMGDVTEHVLTHPAAGVALSVRPDGQIVGVGATGAPDALADAVRAVAAALGGETAPLDLAALSRLAADAGLPWEHDGGGEIVRAGAGSAGWIGETLHVGDPEATRRYAELIVGAVNALPTLLRLARAAQEAAALADRPVDAHPIPETTRED